MQKTLKQFFIPLILSHICIILIFASPQINLWLEYDRAAVASGEIWRLLTPNLIHLGVWHTLMNLAGLWFTMILFVHLLRQLDWLIWFLVLFIANIIGLYLWVPSLEHYVGMSGALYGLIAAAAAAELRLGIKISGVLLIIVAIKIFLPQLIGVESRYNDWLGGHVIEEAHVIGFIQGLILGLVWPKARLNRPKSSLTKNKDKIDTVG